MKGEEVAESLAAIIGGISGWGKTRALLERFGRLRRMAQAGYAELIEAGLEPDEANRVLAALRLAEARILEEASPPTVIRSPRDAAVILREMAFLEQEQIRVLLLDHRGGLLRQVVVVQGAGNVAVVTPLDVLREAVRENAPKIILGHNHPSGDPTPSPEDVRTTENISRAARTIGVELLDHVVVGSRGYCTITPQTYNGGCLCSAVNEW
ncbi:MAG: JAB domain-containing protein [Chloroflexia bacterium]